MKNGWRRKSKHPMQRIRLVVKVPRFVENEIVKHLIDTYPGGLNSLHLMLFSREDWEQVTQQLGYSVSGFGDLSTSSQEMVVDADAEAAKIVRCSQDRELRRAEKK